MKEWIRQLCAAPGPSGEERRVAELIGEWVRSYADEVRRDALGNVIAIKRPRAGNSGKTVVLSAHMDEPGVVAQVASLADAHGAVDVLLALLAQPL